MNSKPERVVRDCPLTAEEAARDNELRRAVQAEFPPSPHVPRFDFLFTPDELPKPPFEWPLPLIGLDGSPDRLSGIKVWYDFDWKFEFAQTRLYKGFKNSRQLTAFLKEAAPDGKTPQLLLTKLTGHSQDVIETEKEFVLVVNIDEFKEVPPNKAVSLFARKLGGSIITSAEVRRFVETEDGGKALLSFIKRPTLRDWFREKPQRVGEYLEVFSEVQAVELSDEVKQGLLKLCLQAEPDKLAKIAQCLTSAEPAMIVAAFERLDLASLKSLNAAANLGALKATLAKWEENKTCKNEGFWQKWFEQQPFILSQLFSYPVVIMEGSAYFGGTALSGKGDKLGDFLIKNKLTKNTAIIEIKTPMTPLVGKSHYRDTGMYAMHKEVTGAIVQAATYKNTFLTELAIRREAARQNGSDTDFEVFDPPLFVIAGSSTNLLDAPGKKRSFELFRNALSNVQLVLFDELFSRIQSLVDLLESGCNHADTDYENPQGGQGGPD